jgi:peptide deformylase
MSDELKELKNTLKKNVKPLPIVTDKGELRKRNSLVKNVNEAAEIAEHLWNTLSARGENDVGLSAPQIGIHKKMCIVRAKTPIALVNPKIVETNGETWFQEGCVSFPGVSIRTKRFKNVVLEVDWLGEHDGMTIIWKKKQTLYFAASEGMNMEDDSDLLESIAVQHETDHLEGILMFDREWKNEPVKVGRKYGRNERIDIQHSGTSEVIRSIKYKVYERDYLEKGWVII